MRLTVLLPAFLTVVSLVAVNYASACDCQGMCCRPIAVFCPCRHPAEEARNRLVSAQPSTRGFDHRSVDEKLCAELGPEWCRMITRMHDTDPYPVCKAWKWDAEDGWDWDWSEFNCPWKQCHNCDLD